jgi:hypothetical protein
MRNGQARLTQLRAPRRVLERAMLRQAFSERRNIVARRVNGRTKPLVDALGGAQLPAVSGRSTYAGAIRYTLSRWDAGGMISSGVRAGSVPGAGKASSFPTRPRPTQLRCLRGLTRTEAPRAAGADTSYQLRLDRRRRRRTVPEQAPHPGSSKSTYRGVVWCDDGETAWVEANAALHGLTFFACPRPRTGLPQSWPV